MGICRSSCPSLCPPGCSSRSVWWFSETAGGYTSLAKWICSTRLFPWTLLYPLWTAQKHQQPNKQSPQDKPQRADKTNRNKHWANRLITHTRDTQHRDNAQYTNNARLTHILILWLRASQFWSWSTMALQSSVKYFPTQCSGTARRFNFLLGPRTHSNHRRKGINTYNKRQKIMTS